MTDTSEKQTVTVTAAAQQLQADSRTVRRWINAGESPNAYRLSPIRKSPYRIPATDLEDFKKRRQTIPSP